LRDGNAGSAANIVAAALHLQKRILENDVEVSARAPSVGSDPHPRNTIILGSACGVVFGVHAGNAEE